MNYLPFLLLFFINSLLNGQDYQQRVEAIRLEYNIPELAFAIVNKDSIIASGVMGFKKIGSNIKAENNDKFRIGSTTKLITSYLAAIMVKKGRISWETKFFDLYPELRSNSHPAYHQMTLYDLVNFKIDLMRWTYSYEKPLPVKIKGNLQAQRYKFFKWIIQQPPLGEKKEFFWSNPAYVAAGMMLEKASGKPYESLVDEFGKELGIDFGFGQPNFIDSTQPWGHDENLNPEKPALNKKLNWLSSAGNIHVNLGGFIKFIQLELKALAGQSEIFSAEEFQNYLFGSEHFSYGWRQITVDTLFRHAYHHGNPGTFVSRVYISQDTELAFIIFANVQSAEAERGLDALFDFLKIANMGIHVKLKSPLTFEQFAVDSMYNGKLALPDFSTTEIQDTDYHDYILDGCREIGVNFAGKYTILTKSCGAECQHLFMINRENGKIIDQLNCCTNGCYGYTFNANSSLLIANSELFIDDAYSIYRSFYCKPAFYVWEKEKFRQITVK